MSQLADFTGLYMGFHSVLSRRLEYNSGRPTGIGLARSKTFFADGELRAHASGAVELAFDHHNGDVIMKTNVAAEICRAAKDIDRQLFRRK